VLILFDFLIEYVIIKWKIMKYPTVFHLISTKFKKAEIPSVLIGGFALNYYGVTRQTADVDFLITEEDITKALRLLEKAGYKQRFRQQGVCREKIYCSFFEPSDCLETPLH
jgi:hypothetical protein